MKKRIKFLWNNQKLKRKFLIIIIPSAIMSSIVIMAMSYYIFREYEDNLYNLTVENVNLVIKRIEMELYEAEELSDRIVTNNTFQSALQTSRPNIRKKEISSDYNRIAQQFYKVLQEKSGEESNIISISAFVEEEWYYVGSRSSDRYYNEEIVDRMQDCLNQSNGETVWYIDEYPTDRIYGIRKIKDLYNLTFRNLGILVIEYDIASTITSLMKQNGKPEDASNIVIFDDKGILLSGMSESQSVEWKSDVNYAIISVDNIKYFASYVEASNYGWKYIFMIPFDDVFGYMQGLEYIFLLIAVAILTLSIFYGEKLSSIITVQFDYLLERMKSVQEGNFETENVEYYDSRTDEIGRIRSNFESMVNELDKLIKDNYIKQMLIRENQLKVLQNQINPHFLFNTLQTINWKAKESDQKTISQIVEALGKLLRYTLQEDNDPVSIKDEIRIVENYITIQKFRYQDRLKVNIKIAESLYEQKIPKLALQNIVENSIKYALENMLEPCRIEIWAEDNEKTYKIFIQDNGPGIDETVLDVHMKSEEEGQHKAGLGIGLVNINRRIGLMFSDEYGLKIHNRGNGTLVEFYLPKSFTEERNM